MGKKKNKGQPLTLDIMAFGVVHTTTVKAELTIDEIDEIEHNPRKNTV